MISIGLRGKKEKKENGQKQTRPEQTARMMKIRFFLRLSFFSIFLRRLEYEGASTMVGWFCIIIKTEFPLGKRPEPGIAVP